MEQALQAKCEWCGVSFRENDRMMELIVAATGCWVCYECALEWVQEPRLRLEFDVE